MHKEKNCKSATALPSFMKDKTVWLKQKKMMAALFEVSAPTINDRIAIRE